MNVSFSNDVQWNWNKIKTRETKIYKIEKKIEVTSAPPFNWPWFEHFYIIFFWCYQNK
jgi:hypothetical protein